MRRHSLKVRGQRALITGGQRGLGAAFAAELLRRGADRVYVTARTPKASDDPRVIPLPLDVTDPDSVAALAEAAADVAIVFNNAGVAGGIPLLQTTPETISAIFDTNVLGPIRVAQAFAPLLGHHDESLLVNLHSVLSWLAGAGAYGASKAALWSVTNSLRLELRAQGTSVVGVHLDLADTDMTARFTDHVKISPADVASRVLNAIERGEEEVLVDDASRAAKRLLAGPVQELIARL
ncbi:SDR family oxidoreductase [Jatrophihabitans lederbergiae]|uniref:SDR family oxidoreductase n=1 Tax=Jatrophihabitans lederbergiae TaxID=3075547 RepID=A0ABU2JGP8_9ACTN|nr:SDR family oxidoreductase [Jatrophihabitans sp. DSM 44399]MDT0264155.1 SDR family oxidoreductase [Jatrophihabitans sp. DSM 44399]